MLIDNKNELQKHQKKTIYEYLETFMSSNGQFDFVTGYFTISALARLEDKLNSQKNYRIVLGDLFSVQPKRRNIIDIINQKHLIKDVFNLKDDCEKAVKFLSRDSVLVKTVDKNFCHAKTYIYQSPDASRHNDHFYIVGSSNFTDAGLGMRYSSNIELNKLVTGTDSSFEKAQEWFQLLWDADSTKSEIANEEGRVMNCKTYLKQLIADFFEKYSPETLYYKTLYELFKEELLQFQADISSQKDLVHLSDSVVFNKLYDFQKKGVMSLIRMMNDFGGAILADAVGLGKTWSALAVIKYYELQGYKVLLLCPKKLENNWLRFLKNRHSIFDADSFEYFVRYHTDLYGSRMNKDGVSLSTFRRFQKLLIVIDESHNLRNDESGRYQFLVDNLYKGRENREIKTLMLSATPINNKLIDVRNQFKLIVRGKDNGFKDIESIAIASLKNKFSQAQKKFGEWQMQKDKKISQLRANIPDEIFQLVDKLVVARTRQLIKHHLKANIHFPTVASPDNEYAGDFPIHELKDTTDILVLLGNVGMTAYQPAKYMIEEGKSIEAIKDDRTRQKGIAKLMHILLIKRLESSWWGFYKTLTMVYQYHLSVLKSAKLAKGGKSDIELDNDEEIWEPLFDELEIEGNEMIGKKVPVKATDIKQIGSFIKDLEKDCKYLKALTNNFDSFWKKFTDKDNKLKVCVDDEKLEKLISKIEEKRKKNPDRKIIVFSVFRDTAKYLYDQLKLRGYKKMALITGSENQCDYIIRYRNGKDDFEPLVERFAPYTKLFKEKDHRHFVEDGVATEEELNDYEKWKKVVESHDKLTAQALNEPIDLLIATDCLSEGQNLQDADCLINYDIHWNPVRLIQRFGRIDRLGSQYDTIYGINFWPAKKMDDFLNLKTRVEGRMAAGTLIGMEVNEISETFRECLDTIDDIVRNQSEKMFKQLEVSWEDIEGKTQSFGFAELSYEQFRQELMEQLNKDKDLFEKIPNGVYSGFNTLSQSKFYDFGAGLAGLLGYPAKEENAKDHHYEHLDLFYINTEGTFQILNNMEVLHALRENKMNKRFVPDQIEKPTEETIAKMKSLLEKWMSKKFSKEDGDLLEKIASGSDLFKPPAEDIPAARFKIDNYDLITWFVISKNQSF
jgi:Helicase conserved C-terminal domain/PLD-like domain/Type III restriction enzyme, res subunit